jgi:protein-L-isoaspartate(D-aspartate) O-methyltransferase
MDREELARQLNSLMIDAIKQSGQIRSSAVENAFRSILRHRLLPPEFEVSQVYQDTAVVLKVFADSDIMAIDSTLSSSTMPSLLAGILEASQLTEGLRILQIGTGPGYLAALIAHIISKSGLVVTIEIDEEISLLAQERLLSTDLSNIQCVIADGYYGCSALAPYDRIIATASCADIPQSWVDQLNKDGLIILPFAFSQKASCYPMIAFHKEEGFLNGRIIPSLPRVGFLPLYGKSVSYPVVYEKLLTKLEMAISLRLNQTDYQRNDSKSIYLIAMLYIAEEAQNHPEKIAAIDLNEIYAKALGAWKRLEKPTVDKFAFYLMPKGLGPKSHEWRFIKEGNNLFVRYEP